MEKKSTSPEQQGKHEHPLPNEISEEQRKINEQALNQAEKDMGHDAEFTAHTKNDDLDEGESARLGENMKDII